MALGIFELDLLKDVSDDAFVVKGATVTVYIEGGGLATLYDDITGTTGPTNPFTLGSTESTIEFYADQDSRYRVEIVSGAFSRTLRYRSVNTNAQDLKDYSDAAVATHSADVDEVHGIALGDAVESVLGAQAKADAVQTNLTSHINSATPHTNLTLPFDDITWPTSQQIGSPIHIDTLDELVNHWTSAGIMHGCDITDNGDGTVSIDSGYGLLHATADSHLPMYTVEISAQGPIALTDQSENYIYIDYNAGSPTFNVGTSSTAFNCIDKCIAYYIYRDGTNLNIIDAKEQNVDSNRKSRRLFLEFQKFIHAYQGTELGGSGLALTVTEGSFYYMLERLPHPAFDTSVAGTANENIFTLWYRDGVGGWTETIEQKTIDTTVYDNNTGTPVTLTSNRFGVSWVYIVHDSPSSLHVVMGSLNVTSQAEAEAASPPSALPGLLGAHASLIGFVVYEEGNTVFDNVLSAFAQSFTASAATNHNALAGLQGGTVSEYYHFTETEHTAYGYHTRERNIAAPNATVPVHSITATGAEANIDAAFTPKGTGAILAQVPDGTAAGGNKRGDYAVDLQTVRAAATQVVSGNYSAISGGDSNLISSRWSVIGGGEDNSITVGDNAFIGGGWRNSTTEIFASICGGNDNTSSGSGAHIGGGRDNTASGTVSVIIGGQRATTRGLFARESFSSGSFSVDGDAQLGRQSIHTETNDATPAILTAANGGVTSSYVAVLPNNHSYGITAKVTAIDTTNGDTKRWIIEGLAYRGATAASTVIVGTPSKSTIAESAGAAAWDVDLIADTTLGAAEIQVTGEVAKTIHWVCTFETEEVG